MASPSIDNGADKEAIIRKFILNAPAGELRDVLKPLRVLTGDDDVFYKVVSDCCLDYHLRHQSCFQVKDVAVPGGEPLPSVVLMTSKANHLLTRLKQVAKVSSKKYANLTGDLEASVSAYLASGADALGAAIVALGPDGRPLTQDDDVETQFEDLSRVFFDFNATIYFEIDPVESRVIRTLSFLGGSSDASDAASLLYEAVESVLSADSADYAGVVPYLIAEVAAYVSKNYVESSVDERTRMLAATEGNPQGTRASSASSREPLSHCASHVSLHASGNSITISITSERYRPKAFWAGRWKSIFLISTANADEDKEEDGVTIVGETRLHTHTFEDGNIHLEATRKLSRRVIYPSGPTSAGDGDFSPATVAKKIIKEVKAYESSIQTEMETCCATVGESALKALRRKLPISKVEFNFRKAASSVSGRGARHE